MRHLLAPIVLLLCACQSADSESDSKTRAQLDKAKAELADAKQKLAEAREKLRQYREAREASKDENGDAPELPPVGNSIRCESRERCVIDRPYFDLVMASPLRLLDQMRIMPWQKDGEMRGIKLFGIDEGTIPAALGLKGGDIVVAVGGQALASFNDVMTLGSKLGPTNRYVLDLERDEETFALQVELVDPPAAETPEPPAAETP